MERSESVRHQGEVRLVEYLLEYLEYSKASTVQQVLSILVLSSSAQLPAPRDGTDRAAGPGRAEQGRAAGGEAMMMVGGRCGRDD